MAAMHQRRCPFISTKAPTMTKNWHITAGVRVHGLTLARPTASPARPRAKQNASTAMPAPLPVRVAAPLAVAAAQIPVTASIPAASARWMAAARRSVAGGEAGSATGWVADRAAGWVADRAAGWVADRAAGCVAGLAARGLAGRVEDARLADFDIT